MLSKFRDGEDAQISGVQLLIERVSDFFGSPAYFAFAIAFIIVWMLINAWGAHAGWRSGPIARVSAAARPGLEL